MCGCVRVEGVIARDERNTTPAIEMLTRTSNISIVDVVAQNESETTTEKWYEGVETMMQQPEAGRRRAQCDGGFSKRW